MDIVNWTRSRSVAEWASRFPPRTRRFLLIGLDACLLPLAVWLSFWLRLANPWPTDFLRAGLWMLLSVLLIGLPLYALTGQYKGLTRYVGSAALYRLAARNALLVLILSALGVMLRLPMPPRSSWLLLWVLLTTFTGAVRFALRDILLSLRVAQTHRMNRVLIYGAGEAGAQLAASLQRSRTHQVLAFLDDAPVLRGRTINGIPIQSSSALAVRPADVDQVLLAIPSLTRSQRSVIVKRLQQQGLSVLQIPSLEDITSGRARIDALRPVAIEDLLGRDSIPPDPKLLGPGIRGAAVCVSGAGGSIGSELCRTLLLLNPRRLILLDVSEPALYSIEQELRGSANTSCELIPVLGSAADAVFLQKLFAAHEVQVVFHAAAYKHVPLVEANPIAGLANNALSTRVLCRAAVASDVGQVVLISTDKAVRPSNVMGATKRLAEMIIQAFAKEAEQKASASQGSKTIFSMVRFGNVLGSSGSVVPLFRRQIKEGGPITLTHPEIIRYFMTIPEAAQLVLQAAALAQGGDLFLLDMGEPVRIKDLAEQMVRLSGLSLRDARNPNGEIEIVCTGLRPGEKLYEELLIDAESQATKHPLIFRAHEDFLDPEVLWQRLDAIEALIAAQDVEAALGVLAELVPEWHRTVVEPLQSSSTGTVRG